jgi:glycerol-3-phosphate acyltransferase PlsY
VALVVALAYVIGSVPFALLLARRWGAPDLRRVGSGNLGAANVFRASGATAGVLVAALDIAKGALSVTLARYLSHEAAAPAAAGLAAILGHVYPVWLRFRGGKGVATACGVFSVLTPTAMAPALVVFAFTVWLTKYISLGSVLATLALPPIAYLAGSPAPAIGSAVAAATLIVFRHRSNLLRLRTGSERRLGGHEFDRRQVDERGQAPSGQRPVSKER